MSNPTFFPTQIGYQPAGQLFLGKTISGSYEGIGFGANGRPDPLQVLQINLAASGTETGTYVQWGTITLNVADLVAAKAANTNVPTNLNLVLKEVSVCDLGQTKKMMIIASQTYAAP